MGDRAKKSHVWSQVENVKVTGIWNDMTLTGSHGNVLFVKRLAPRIDYDASIDCLAELVCYA